MTSPLDAFREQREVAEKVHARLMEVAALLVRLREEVELLVGHKELRAVLQQEQTWLRGFDRAIAEVRAWREEEARRFWPGIIRRWALTLIFAIASAAAAGAGYAHMKQPCVAELAALQLRADFASAISDRIMKMTPTERRQFDALMEWRAPSR